MTKAVGEGIRVLAMLGMLILVPLSAMFGSKVLTRWAQWIYEGPLGAKSASAREATPPFQWGKPRDVASGLIQQRGHNGEDSSQIYFRGGRSNHSEGDTLVSTSPNGGNSFNETGKDGERFPFGEYKQSFSGQSIPPLLPLRGGEEKKQMSLPKGETGYSELLDPWQKECQQLGRYLEELGATEYQLEIWGDQGRLYHFQCEVKVLPEGQLWTRHFEATASTPAGAMEKVLQDVQQWREGRKEGFLPTGVFLKEPDKPSPKGRPLFQGDQGEVQ